MVSGFLFEEGRTFEREESEKKTRERDKERMCLLLLCKVLREEEDFG
jgi:hypothetical protein